MGANGSGRTEGNGIEGGVDPAFTVDLGFVASLSCFSASTAPERAAGGGGGGAVDALVPSQGGTSGSGFSATTRASNNLGCCSDCFGIS